MKIIQDALARREVAVKAAAGYDPQTSVKFQEDLSREIFLRRNVGRGIIEVGCYSGGTTIILGKLCEELGWPLFVVDVAQQFIDLTRSVLDAVGDTSDKHFFTGTFAEFVEVADPFAYIYTVFIDACHHYEFVRGDIETIYKLRNRPFHAAFHDYSLRSSDGKIGVDRAIHDCWGENAPFIRIGHQISPLPPVPSSIGDYWEPNGSEGAFVNLGDVVDPAQILR